jgi:nitrogen regulatory protein PII 1
MEETNMKMIKAIVRPEKSEDVLDALLAGGFAAATKMSVLGRGKQKGLKVGDTYYDEIPKELIMLVVEDGDVDKVLKVIVERNLRRWKNFCQRCGACNHDQQWKRRVIGRRCRDERGNDYIKT